MNVSRVTTLTPIQQKRGTIPWIFHTSPSCKGCSVKPPKANWIATLNFVLTLEMIYTRVIVRIKMTSHWHQSFERHAIARTCTHCMIARNWLAQTVHYNNYSKFLRKIEWLETFTIHFTLKHINTFEDNSLSHTHKRFALKVHYLIDDPVLCVISSKRRWKYRNLWNGWWLLFFMITIEFSTFLCVPIFSSKHTNKHFSRTKNIVKGRNVHQEKIL